jgi:hypothetical protein
VRGAKQRCGENGSCAPRNRRIEAVQEISVQRIFLRQPPRQIRSQRKNDTVEIDLAKGVKQRASRE